VAVLLGNEPRGLAPEVIAACDGTLSVPTVGQVESLNVAAAGAVLLYGLQQVAGR
jgi:tRNA G18 (ribose-2'-O)-methylase SpoU